MLFSDSDEEEETLNENDAVTPSIISKFIALQTDARLQQERDRWESEKLIEETHYVWMPPFAAAPASPGWLSFHSVLASRAPPSLAPSWRSMARPWKPRQRSAVERGHRRRRPAFDGCQRGLRVLAPRAPPSLAPSWRSMARAKPRQRSAVPRWAPGHRRRLPALDGCQRGLPPPLHEACSPVPGCPGEPPGPPACARLLDASPFRIEKGVTPARTATKQPPPAPTRSISRKFLVLFPSRKPQN